MSKVRDSACAGTRKPLAVLINIGSTKGEQTSVEKNQYKSKSMLQSIRSFEGIVGTCNFSFHSIGIESDSGSTEARREQP